MTHTLAIPLFAVRNIEFQVSELRFYSFIGRSEFEAILYVGYEAERSPLQPDA